MHVWAGTFAGQCLLARQEQQPMSLFGSGFYREKQVAAANTREQRKVTVFQRVTRICCEHLGNVRSFIY